MERKKNNNGSAIIMTIVAVAFLCLIVALILTITVYNYRMKTTDLRAKRTFYSAETALDEIRAGLQQDVAEVLSKTYISSMEHYMSVDAANRDAEFKTDYRNELHNKLKRSSDDGKYNIEHLSQFLKKTAWDEEKQTGAKINDDNPDDESGTLLFTEDGIVLQNVDVKYRDNKGYLSEIKTDIVLAYPNLNLSQASDSMELLNYALVANTALQCSEGKTLNIKGSAYVGKEGASIKNSTVYVSSSSAATSLRKDLLITNGGIKAADGSNLAINGMEIWAKNLVTDSSQVTVEGDSYISNDIVVNNAMVQVGGGSSTGITMSGNLYGYGSIEAAMELGLNTADNPAGYSSAILVNGINARVDLSGLSNMLIAGQSYVGASETSEAADYMDGNNNSDVIMGESISIKRDQMAYLVPAECVVNGQNPMTVATYQRIKDQQLVDFEKVTNTYGMSLNAMGIHDYEVVCYPMSKGSMVYVFMKFHDEVSANQFFERYYSMDKNQNTLKGNLNVYAPEYGLKMPSNIASIGDVNKVYFNGGIVVNDSDGGNSQNFYVGKGNALSGTEKTALLARQKEYYRISQGLNTNLNKDYARLEENKPGRDSTKDVYGNLVCPFQGYTGTEYDRNFGLGEKIKVFEDSVLGMSAIVVSGDSCTIGEITESGDVVKKITVDGTEQILHQPLKVVITSGDVIVNQSFTGMIIAKGTVDIGCNFAMLTADSDNVFTALNIANDKGVKPYMYIIGFSGMLGENESLEEDAGSKIGISDLVTYENWKKQ